MIRGTKRARTNSGLNRNVNVSIHNRFDIEVVDASDGHLRTTARAENIICDQLWSAMLGSAATGQASGYFYSIHYGSGSGTPAVEDISLFNFVGYGVVKNMTVDIDYDKGVVIGKGSIQLSASTAVGVELTEVGIARGTSASTLCTHAMLKDMNGNPVSIRKTDTDVVNIYATVYAHFDTRGYDNSCINICSKGDFPVVNSSDVGARNYGLLPGLVGSGGIFAGNTSLFYSASTLANPGDGGSVNMTKSADLENRTITYTASRLENTIGNIGGITTLSLNSVAYYQSGGYRHVDLVVFPGGEWYHNSEIIAEAVATGDGVTKDFRLDFPYAHDVRVYVDGVERTDFTVDYADPKALDTNRDSFRPCVWLREDVSTDAAPVPTCPYFSGTNGGTSDGYQKLFYNKMHAIGLTGIRCRGNATLYASNDLETWDEIAVNSYSYEWLLAVPEEYAHYKYFRSSADFYSNTTTQTTSPFLTFDPAFTGEVLHFASPPPEGAVITADYISDCIAKDENHVFDFSLTIQLNERVEG